MIINYQILEHHKLFIQKYTGGFSQDKYIAFLHYIVKSGITAPIVKVLTDLRGVSLDKICPPNLEDMISLRKRLVTSNVYNIYIINKPEVTAFIHMYNDKLQLNTYKYCSTLDFALSQLALTEYKEEIEPILLKPAITF